MIESITQVKYARFSRLAAILVDSFIFHSIYLLILFVFVNSTRGAGNVLVLINAYLFLILISIPLNAYFYKNFGGSIGKILCGLKVTNLKTGEYLNFNDYFFREYIGKLFSGVLVFLGYIYIFYNPKSQAFHDLMANTVVTKDNSYKAVISPLVTLIIFLLLLTMFFVKIGNENLISKVEGHMEVLGTQTEYQLQELQK